eukprot:TRINITY_DN2003_c0_g1_i4.p1 TRINITY_DN2003_c0_g1~~TRINITY_DN2003_c0_g1_i4.p1  ORF type:complete len:312 (+),score=58.02 TRINITY_DN2003_c0_g1_i4:247-1182(+)
MDFSKLPKLILYEIFLFFDLKDLYNCLMVNKRFKSISDQENIWRNYLMRKENYTLNQIEKKKEQHKCNYKELVKLYSGLIKECTVSASMITTNITTNKKALKAVMVGDSGVGKSSIVNRIVDNIWEDNNNNTIGAQFKIKYMKIGGKEIVLQLWDTAGPERFRSITSMYYRGASIIFLTFDLNNNESLTNLERWVREIREVGGYKGLIVLLGNKCDLHYDKDVLTKAFQLAKNKRLLFFEVSAKTGHNIEECSIEVLTKIMSRIDQSNFSEFTTPTVTPKTPNKNNCSTTKYVLLASFLVAFSLVFNYLLK